MSIKPPVVVAAGDSASSTTRSGISAGVIEVTDGVSQLERTGKTAEETVVAANRDVSSDKDSSGALANNFDKKSPLLYGHQRSMMSQKNLVAAAAALLLSACATTHLPAISQQYDPSNSARIRLFGQNGNPSFMIVEVSQGKTVEVTVGGSAGDAFSSFLGTTKNESIGISETESTKNMQQRSNLLSNVFYREFVIPAGRKLQVRNAFIELGHFHDSPRGSVKMVKNSVSCSSDIVSFVPEPGKDYEVGSYRNGRECSVMVFEIRNQQGTVLSTPIEID
ncbi:hypothetical protein [Pandoraea soli]